MQTLGCSLIQDWNSVSALTKNRDLSFTWMDSTCDHLTVLQTVMAVINPEQQLHVLVSDFNVEVIAS